MIKTELKEAKEIIKSIDCLDDIELKQAINTILSELERLEVANDAKERQIKILIGQKDLKDLPWY